MNKRQAQLIVDRYLPLVKSVLGLENELIYVHLKKHNMEIKEADYGQCAHLPEYHEANITLFYNLHKTEDNFKLTLFHELSHVFLGEYSRYQDSVAMTLDETSTVARILNENFRQSNESVTVKLSNVLFKIFESVDKPKKK